MIITHNIDLDVSRQGVQATIPITRGENGARRIVFRLRNKGVPIVFEPKDTATLYFNSDAFDPIVVYPNCLLYDVTAQASAEVGVRNAKLQISAPSMSMVYSAEIAFNVCENETYKSNVLNSPPYAAVIKASLIAEENAYNAEAAKEAAEVIKQNAIEAQHSAENARDLALSHASAAEAAKEAAEGALEEVIEYFDKEILGGVW